MTGDGFERRGGPSEVRMIAPEGDGGPLRVRGHAAVFDVLSEELFGFREKIAPGAFAGAADRDVRALINHDDNLVLGRTRAGTLRVSEDGVGLAVEIDMPDTAAARDLAESMRRGDVDQMSFGFVTREDSFETVGGDLVRTLHKVDLFDVSVVTFPAYPQTDAALRSLERWRQEASEASARRDLSLRRLTLARASLGG